MKRGKTTNRQGIYSKFEPLAQKAIDTLVLAMEKGNWPTKVGAAKIILAKLVPDLKAIQSTPDDNKQIIVKIVDEYLPNNLTKQS